MTFDIIDYGTVTDEPISLADVKVYMRIDSDYASDDNGITMSMIAARERLEQYLNVGLANRDVTVQWSGGALKLPLSPTVSVATVTDKDGEVLPADQYTVSEWRDKTIFVNSAVGCTGLNYFYNLNGNVEVTFPNGQLVNASVYTVEYNTGYESEDLPSALKQALLAEIDYLYKLRGMPVTDLVSPNAAMLASGYSKNLVL